MACSKNSDVNRNGQGQWADGNAGGPGNPRARFAPNLRNALNECITIEMVQNVVNHIYERALSGDMPAARLFLQYAVGKPARIDSKEESQRGDAPERESKPEATYEQAVTEAAIFEQTVGDGEPVGESPGCEVAPGEQTAGDVEPVGESPRCGFVPGEQTVRAATKQTVLEVNPEQANGETSARAPRIVAGGYSDASRMG